MDQARTSWLADEEKCRPLVQEAQAHQQRRELASKKLERLANASPFMRFCIQLVTDEWQRTLEAEIQNCTPSLDTLQKQIQLLREHQATTFASYQQAEQRQKELLDLIATWTKKRDTRAAIFQDQKEEALQKIKDLDQELREGNPRITELEQAIEKGAQERALLEEALARLDQQVIDAKREAAREVVERAQIVGATLTGLYMNPVLLQQEWDVVIVDEGSMASPPAVLVAANRAQAHLIVVGDPHQPAPVCKFQDERIKRWLGRDIFHLGGYTLEQGDAGIHHSVLLPYQGRMHSAICDLIRGTVYKGRLKDRDPNKPRPKMGPEPEHPVVLYNTGGSPRAEQPASRSSRFNTYHAEISVHLAQLVLADFSEDARKPECIGIVMPYAAHREVLKDLVRGTDLEVLSRGLGRSTPSRDWSLMRSSLTWWNRRVSPLPLFSRRDGVVRRCT